MWSAIFFAIALIALLVAFVAGLAAGGALTVVTAGAGAPAGGGVVALSVACCNPVQAVAIAVAVGAGVGAAIAGAGDYPDEPFRRGQEATVPPKDMVTTAERLELALSYPEPVIAGTAYGVDAKWTYTRELSNVSTGQAMTLTHSVSERRQNDHVLSKYEVEHPDIVRVSETNEDKGRFTVKARFFGRDGAQLRADQLFVQCYLEGTEHLQGRFYRFAMQDHTAGPDELSETVGTYTGEFYFSNEHLGKWDVTVVAQDVNHAREDMTPEEAATFVGSQVLTNQLQITTSGGTCPFTPDGSVKVI